MDESLFNLLSNCTVRLEAPGGARGTGFFVAPGLILTCAHVVESAMGDAACITAHCDGKPYEVQEIVKILPNPYPDLALLQIGLREHSYVYLDSSVLPGDGLFAQAAYTSDHSWGEAATVEYEGKASISSTQWFLKFKRGQILPGYSGAPLLNMRTWGVCGVVKGTRDVTSDQGGIAIPVEIVFSKLPDLASLYEEAHTKDPRWMDACPRVRSSPVLAQKTLPIHGRVGPLYDCKYSMDEAQKALSRKDGPGLWIIGNKRSGKTRLVTRLIGRCLTQRLFDDCLYYPPDQRKNHTLAEYKEFVLRELLNAGRKLEDKILLVVDDLTLFSDAEREILVEYLENELQPSWQAVVVGGLTDYQTSCSDSWCVISIEDPLKLDEIGVKEFVEEFTMDYADYQPGVKRILEQVGKARWLSDLCKRTTQGGVEALLTVLGKLVPGTQYADALNVGEDPMRRWIMETTENLSYDHLCLLRILLLFETSASKEMLENISNFSPNVLTRLLEELFSRLLVEGSPAEDKTVRYQLASGKREYIAQECQQEEYLFIRFVHWWLDYAWVNGEKNYRPSKLSVEHENLMGILDQLWTRASTSFAEDLRSDDNVPPSFSVFPQITDDAEIDAAEKYTDMYSYLHRYLRYEGRWYEYRRNIQRAYAIACGLGDIDRVVKAASDAAYTNSLEGRCSPSQLDIADGWVKRLKEVYNIDNANHEKNEKYRARALRMEGVIAMRRAEYGKSRSYFQDALDCLQNLNPESEYVSKKYLDKERAGIYSFLAVLAMKYDASLENALGYIGEAIKFAEASQDEEDQAIFKTNKAEMYIWWGEHEIAAEILAEVLPKSHELGWKELWADGLYSEAFVYQNWSEVSKCRSNIDAAMQNIDIAIQRAEEALKVRRETLREKPSEASTCGYFLKLCSNHFLLAGLYLYRAGLSNDSKDYDRFIKHRGDGHNLLEMRKALYSDPEKLDPETRYFQACDQIMSGTFSEPDDFLVGALQLQPGLQYRASNDFCFHLPGAQRHWEFLAKPPRILGGEV